MKRSKSLVITSLLFSTMILNPTVIQGAIVQAEAANQAQATEVSTAINQDEIQNIATNGAVASETKEITVQYQDVANNSHKIANGKMTVAKNAKNILGKDAPMPEGYEFSDRKAEVRILKGNKVIIKVRAVKVTQPTKPVEVAKVDVTVNYVNDQDANTTIADSIIKAVAENATAVDAQQVSVPSGYKLVEGQNFAINNGKITVHVVPVAPVAPVEETKEITIKYLDTTNNMKKIPNGTMTVAKHAKKVAGETVPLPDGYQISARRLIYIQHGQILVHVKPINVNAGHEVSKSDVVVNYVNDKNIGDKIAAGVIKDVADNATSVSVDQVSVPKGYKLVEGQKFAVSYGKVTVHLVPVEETKQIVVKYLDTTNNMKKIADSTMTVAKNAKKVPHETVPLPDGYQISARRLISIKNGHILVHVKPVNFNAGHEVSKSDVIVKYVNDKNTNEKITDGVIKDVKDDATSVSTDLVTAPKGYKLVEGQKFAVSYGKVTVHVVPAEETKEITVKYLDSTNNMKKIPNAKMTVAKNARKVAGETVPLPDGYQISARRLISIKNGHILVHVKPVNVYGGHEVSKSDVIVKYVNDKDPKTKLTDGVIKDVRDDATSVSADLVSAPKGYKLVEGQKFAVSYGKVTVHVVPAEETKEIIVKYLDTTNNMNKLVDSTMTVAKNARKVAHETVPLPDGYQISGRRLIVIQRGQILVHVKPINVNAGHEVSKSDVIVKYVNDKDPKAKLTDGVIKDVKDDATSVSADLVSAPKGYKLVEGQKFAVSYGKVTVHVVPAEETTKQIVVKYLDSTNNMNKIPDSTMTVAKNARKVAHETVPMPDGYQVSARRLIYIQHGHILVHVKPVNVYAGHEVSKSDVIVKYVNDKNANDKISAGVIKDVKDDATSVSADLVTVPAGYKLVEGQKFAVSYGKVTVHVVPAEETKEITVKYLDSTNNMKKIPNGTMTVAKNARKVAHETVPMPEGYQVSGRRLISIKNGRILVHVKPININANDEVKKSDVIVKYINDKDTTVKISDGVIKDVKDSATSVSAELVTAPAGYKLVEGQKFAVSYGKVTVHVVPTETATQKPDETKPTTPETPEVTAKEFTTTVHFVDHQSGEKVHSTKVVGKSGQKHEISLPKEYELATGETNKVSTGKKDTTVSIKVVKKAVEENHRATLGVINTASLYTKDGKIIKDRALAKDSNWITDKKLVVNGETFHRVSTNEWVKASDVYEFEKVNKIITTSNGSFKTLYDAKGNVIKDRALAAGSAWFSDKTSTINGKQMYRVATNEWVLASDLV